VNLSAAHSVYLADSARLERLRAEDRIGGESLMFTDGSGAWWVVQPRRQRGTVEQRRRRSNASREGAPHRRAALLRGPICPAAPAGLPRALAPPGRTIDIGTRSLHGCLRQLEQWTPGEHDPVEAVRARILTLSDVPTPALTAPLGMIARAALERERFRRYVQQLAVEMLPTIEPLGFCRPLSVTKSRRVRAQLAERWGIAPREHYWYPLIEELMPLTMLALQSEYCYLEVPPAALQDVLYRHGVTKLWVVTEFGPSEAEPDRELDTDRFDLAVVMGGGVERYATAKEGDWLIYVSHEHSITFAGDWLVAAVQELWPAWPRRIYTDYTYTYQMHASPELQAADHHFWFFDEEAVTDSSGADRP